MRLRGTASHQFLTPRAMRTKRVLTLLAALVVSLGLATGSAQAVEAGTAGGSADYCVLNLNTGITACATTEIGLKIARVGAAGSFAAALLSVVVGRLYDDNGRSGAYYEIVAGGDCTSSESNVDFQISTLTPSWNDRVSSFQAFGQCGIRLFADAGYSGSSVPTSGYLVSSNYVGAAMNDQATSVRFS